MPPCPTAAVSTTEGTVRVAESDPQTRGQVEQGGAARSAVESRHTEGSRDVALAGQAEIPQAGPSTTSATFAATMPPTSAGSA